MKEVRASVAMAVYNGQKYIKEQINSILSMMEQADELVISYDKSADSTLQIIKEYESLDCRVHIVFDDGHSVESNFNNAVRCCRGKYIFLSDQDDVWINDKINLIIQLFLDNPKAVVVIGDGYITDDSLNVKGSLFRDYHISSSGIRNFIKGTYLGCQMAFRGEIKDKVWPVRTEPPLPHDLWLGVLGSHYGEVILCHEKTIKHRIHDDNYSNTSKMSVLGVIKNRLLFAKELSNRLKDTKK